MTNLVFKTKKNSAKHNLLPFSSIFFYLKKNKDNLELIAWMLCNANPRNKENKNQRTMVTKSIAMKYKDQESQERSGTQNHTNYLTKSLKPTSIKRFSEDVNILTFNKDILKTHNFSFNKIPNEVISNLYVLSLRMLNGLLRDIYSTKVITINNYGILGYPIISQKLLHPKKLWATTFSSNIFCLCSRQRHKIFLFTHPSNKISSYIKTPTCGAFSIISITSSIRIRETSKRQIRLFTIK